MIKINKKNAELTIRMALISLLLLLAAVPAGLTADAVEGESTVETENIIKIQADKLEADINGDTAEFSGNVRIHRGATRITAEYLTLHYNRKGDAEEFSQVDVSALEKIEARGQVRIQHQDIQARTETAVYETRTETLTLEGGETTVTKGTYSIRGVRMVLKGSAGDMTAIGDAGTRVKAVIIADSELF